jgi:hypothetical protein
MPTPPPLNVIPSTPLSNTASKFNGPGAIGVASNGTAVCIYGVGIQNDNTSGGLYCITSTNNGGTWSAPTTLISPVAGNAIPIRCTRITTLASGHMLAAIEQSANASAGNPGNAYILVSTDNGTTWTVGTVISPPASLDGAISYGQIIEISSGGDLWQCWYGWTDVPGNDTFPFIMQCPSGSDPLTGSNWVLLGGSLSAARVMPVGPPYFNETDVCQVNSTTYVAVARRQSNPLYTAITTNSGSTWSAPVQLADQNGKETVTGVSPALLVLSDGNILLTWGERGNIDGQGGMGSMVSANGGSTWLIEAMPFYLSKALYTNLDISYASNCQLSTGDIYAVVYLASNQTGEPFYGFPWSESWAVSPPASTNPYYNFGVIPVMAFTEFFTDAANGSNLNAGDGLSGAYQAAPTMSDTAGTGTYSRGGGATDTYTSGATNGTVVVGQFISIYSSGATIPAYQARITAVSGGSGLAWVITLSNTTASGTRPTNASTYLAQVGGSWAGPSGTVTFPFNFLTDASTDAAGDRPRVNMRNNAVYSMTATLAIPTGFQYCWLEGFTNTPSDGGKAVIDAGGNAIGVVTVASGCFTIGSLIVQNNSGNNDGLVGGNGSNVLFNCIARYIGGSGLVPKGTLIESEAYACNQSNTANKAGITNTNGTYMSRCWAHDNIGTNVSGFFLQGGCNLALCEASGNGLHGCFHSGNSTLSLVGCDIYGNGVSATADGLHTTAGLTPLYIENCNLVLNTGWGINATSNIWLLMRNCGFGSGTQANGSGQYSISTSNPAIEIAGTITYASGVTPWIDPVHGNFDINLAAAENTGRGNFTQTPYLTGTITNATNTSPIVVTSAAHGLTSGARVVITGVGGNTNANATWTVNVVDANTFNLIGSSGNSAYTSGGAWTSGPNSNWTAATTVGYPDVGAATHQAAAGGGGVIVNPGTTGGCGA